jgi:hypothetical protein
VVVLRRDQDEGVRGVEVGGQGGHAGRARVVVAGVLRRRRRQGQRDVEVGQVDDLDVEPAVLAGQLGEPGGDHRPEPPLPHAADHDHELAVFVHAPNAGPARAR